MATEKVVYLAYSDAVGFHFELMLECGETRLGVDSPDLIKSALARPRHSAIYEDADIIRQAATLCFGLIKNHPWLGGNQRTATYLTKIFLEINGFNLNYELVEIVELSLNIEADEWKVDETENWLQGKVEKI